MRKVVIALIPTALLLLAGSASFSSAAKPAPLCIPPIGSITVPGLTCTTTTPAPPKSTTTKPAPSTTAPSTSATTAAAAKAATPPAVVQPAVITPSASQLAGTSGRAGVPTSGALADPATPLLAIPQDALAAPQLASAQGPAAAASPQMVAAGPSGGNVLAAGQSSLVTPSTHPLLRVLLALVAIAIAALAASQLPAARRLMHSSNQ